MVKGVFCFILDYFLCCYAEGGVSRDAQDEGQDVAESYSYSAAKL